PLAAASPQLRHDPRRAARPARVQSSASAREGLHRPGGGAAGLTTLAGAAVSSPHARDRREVDAQIGMIIFLAWWGLLLLTLFFARAVLRLRSDPWPPLGARPLPQTIAAVNTGILLISSLWLHRGVRAVAEGRPAALRVPLSGAMLLGAAFLALQI